MTRYLAHAALLGAALIYSLFNLVAAHTLLHVDPLTFSTAREGGAALLLYIWAAKAESPLRVPSSRADRRLFLLLGVLLASFQLCFMLGIALTSAVTAALLQCVEPTTAALMGSLVGSEPLTADKAVSALLAGGGVVCFQLRRLGQGNARGEARAAGCALLFMQGVGIAAYCLVQKRLVRPVTKAGPPLLTDDSALPPSGSADTPAPPESRRTAYGPITVTAHAAAVSLCALLLAAAAAPLVTTSAPLSRRSIGALGSGWPLAGLLYAVLLASAAGYALRAWANRFVDASVLVLYNVVQPVGTAVLSTLPLVGQREAFGWQEGLGAVMIAGAVGISVFGVPRGRAAAPSDQSLAAAARPSD